MDKPYEDLIKIIKGLSKKKENIYIGMMTSSSSVKINDLTLNKSDLYFAEHLTTGWMHDQESRQEALKSGDTVLVIKANEEYIVAERLVRL